MRNTITLPDGRRVVCRIFDAGEHLADRYTIAFKGYRSRHHGMVYPYLASGPTPFHPQGFGLHMESSFRLSGAYLGKQITFDTLPKDVRSFILQQFELS